jgi:hypothetical protein
MNPANVLLSSSIVERSEIPMNIGTSAVGGSSFCNPIAIGSIEHFGSFLPRFEVTSIQAVGEKKTQTAG